MTQYIYLDEMQNLCLRLSNAFKVTRPKDQALIDLYDAAEEGFFRKKEKLLIVNTGVPIPEEKEERLKGFRDFVIKEEEKAAFKLREEEYEKGDCNSI